MKELFRGKKIKKDVYVRGLQSIAIAGSLLIGSSHEMDAKEKADNYRNEIFIPMIVNDDNRRSVSDVKTELESQVLEEAFDMQRGVEYDVLNPAPVPPELSTVPLLAPAPSSQVGAAGINEHKQNTGKVQTTGENLWLVLADCETGDGSIGAPYYAQWDYNGSSGFDGALQFHPDTWDRINTGYDYAWQAPPEVQISAAQEWLSKTSWGQWPGCRDKMLNAGYKDQMEDLGEIN